MNDTTHRFLTAVLTRIPESSLVELRLFPAIRQGAIESAVAVLAVEPGWDQPAVVAESVELEELEASLLEIEAEDESNATDLGDVVLKELEREAPLPVVVDGAHVVDTDRPVERLAVLADAPPMESEALDPESIALGDMLALPSRDVEPPHASVPETHRRLAILSARYRLVLKGADRGKWNLEIIHQADAPLETLDRVIAGVMRRSGEESEPGRFTRAQLRAALDAPVWARSA